jgi:hypothetical protein
LNGVEGKEKPGIGEDIVRDEFRVVSLLQRLHDGDVGRLCVVMEGREEEDSPPRSLFYSLLGEQSSHPKSEI